jgi:preprotein translocase subunit SecY
MLSGFQNASRIPELRRRLLFTLAMLAVYRLGIHVPTPGIDRQAMAAFLISKRIPFSAFSIYFQAELSSNFRFFHWASCPISAHRLFYSC